MRAALGRVFGVVVAIAVAAGLSEALLRVALPLGEGEVLRRTQSLPGLAPEIVYERNAFGLRALSMQTREKPAGAFRVLCIGASTTDQATQSTPDTWCALLESRLREELGPGAPRIETAGYGRGGAKTADLLGWARTELLGFGPDVVVTLLGINDLAGNGGSDYAYDGTSEPRRALAGRATFLGRCRQVFELCKRLRAARERVVNASDLWAGRAVEWHSRHLDTLRREHREHPAIDPDPRDPDPIHEFADVTEALIGRLRSRDIDVLVLGQPVLWKAALSPAEEQALWFSVNTPDGPVRASGAWLLREMNRYNLVQARLAERLGAHYLDLDARIEKDLDHYFDDCHFTDRGSARVAEEVLSALLPIVEARLAGEPRSIP